MLDGYFQWAERNWRVYCKDVEGFNGMSWADEAGEMVYKSGTGTKKTYATSRPSYGKGQVEQVWENAKDPITGKVYDPSGVEITWDPTKPRNGQWIWGTYQEKSILKCINCIWTM